MAYQETDARGRLWLTKLTTNDSTPIEGAEKLGSIRELSDGRRFRYVRAVGADVALGKLQMDATKVTVTDVSVGSTVNGPDGATTTLITDADATWTNDAYINWYFKVDTGKTGSEEAVKIVGNTTTTLTLEKQLTTTVAALDDGEILPGVAACVVSTASGVTLPILGCGIGTITDTYYGWLQVAGPGSVISTSALTEGDNFSSGGATTSGQAADRATADDNNLGTCIAAGGTNDYQFVNFKIA